MNPLNNNRGVALVFIALFMFLLLVFLGLAVDVGWTTYVRNQGQARVDAAALAAAARAIPLLPSDGARGTVAQSAADTFAGYNHVVDATTNPTNTVEAMHYDYTTHALSGTTWTAVSPTNANAVKVSNAVPTPLFFSGVRNFFGASENGATTINVDATAYLGCPGVATPPLPLAFCKTAINYPTNCNEGNGLRAPHAGDAGFFNSPEFSNMSSQQCSNLVNGVTTMAPVGTSTDISFNNGNLTNCSGDILTRACGGASRTNCNTGTKACPTNNKSPGNDDCTLKNDWCVTVPVVNACDFTKSQPVSGFAEFCIHEVDNNKSPKAIIGYLKCPYTFQGGPGGECFGTVATQPILVQ